MPALREDVREAAVRARRPSRGKDEGKKTTSTASDQAGPILVSNEPAKKFCISIPRMPAYSARPYRRDAASK
jgi:hypothetical protein